MAARHSDDDRQRVGFDSQTQLWATHALECQQCSTVFPVAYGGKAIALREYGGVAEMCPTCEEYTPCEEA